MTSDAERYVLGAVMLSRPACDEVSEILQPADMATPMHETIYSAVRRLHDRDEPTDVVAVADELIRAGALQGNLDAAYLHTLTSDVPTAANAAYYAGIVLAQSKRRRVSSAVERARSIAADATIAADDVVELVREAFDQIDASTSQGVEAIGDWYLEFLGSLDKKPSYTATPWYDLNQLIYGFRDGGMYVIAADTGNGKTVVALQIARALAEERPVLYVSLEMGREEIAARLAAQTGQVFLGAINRHQLAKTDWAALNAHRAEIERLPLAIVSSDEVSTIPQIKAKVRSMARRYKRNPVVVIDYLQLLASHGPVENRQQEVAGFSRSLKLAAQQWNVPVVALSQFRRPQAGQKKVEPTLHDLRESGQIANDADVVLLLHRKPVKAAADELKIIVAKNRQGQTGEAQLVFQGQFARVLSKYQAREDIDFKGDAA
ncbi:replicative DNA helicase [Microbacterium maritypicum]